MSAETVGMIAQVGRLSAQFARRTAERLTMRAPAPAAWATRLAARSEAAWAMPRLTTSLHRLLVEWPPAPNQRPLSRQLRDGSRRTGAEPPRVRSVFLPPTHHVPGPQRMPAQRFPPALAPSAEEPMTIPPGRTTAAPLPPTALRQRLVGQGGTGELLTSSLRKKLHPHLKFDPAMARLHRGNAAAAAARELNAEAFTIGPDVFFGEGRYAPETRRGLSLLAHELTHIGQQTAQIGDRMRFFTPQGGDALESEAQQTAAEVVHSDDQEKRNRTGGALHQASAPPRPALAFALSSARAGATSVPAQKTTEESGQPDVKPSPAQSDARAVTDRVYELMKQEIALSRERGSSRRGR